MFCAFETKMNYMCLYHPNNLFLPKSPPEILAKFCIVKVKKIIGKKLTSSGGGNIRKIRWGGVILGKPPFIIVFILSVTNGAGITWGTEALINVYIYVSFYLVVIKSSKSSRLYEGG